MNSSYVDDEKTTRAECIATLAPKRIGRYRSAGAGVANIAPTMSFFFSFGVIVVAAGAQAPVSIAIAALAIWTVSFAANKFSNEIPSAGSLPSYIGAVFGQSTKLAFTVLLSLGYIAALSAIIAVLGGWLEVFVQKYTGVVAPWEIYAGISVVIAVLVSISKIESATKTILFLVAIEIGVLVLVSIFILAKHHAFISFSFVTPSALEHNWHGTIAGAALAVFLFTGWESPHALAQETRNPKRNVSWATSRAIMVTFALYLVLAIVSTVGFDQNLNALTDAAVPFLDLANQLSPIFTIIVFIAGATSMLGAIVAGANSISRIIYFDANENIQLNKLAQLNPSTYVPWVATLAIYGASIAAAFIFGGRGDPFVFFGESATFGAVLIGLVYASTSIAYIVFMRRTSTQPSTSKVVIPAIGAALIIFAVVSLLPLGQPAPFSYFPALSLVSVAFAAFIAKLLDYLKSNGRPSTMGVNVNRATAETRVRLPYDHENDSADN